MKNTSYHSIVILTGAGISAESGINTFRASDGLWENHKVEEVASPEGYYKNPILVQRFYNERRQQLLSENIQPNPAHEALVKLEKEFNGEFLLVTQNIDDLHERAGSENIIHMHGELLKMRCDVTNTVFDIRGDLTVDDTCLCCDQSGTLRPDIVWFGEMPKLMDEIIGSLSTCDLFIAIGTSGNVYPAAGFVSHARSVGADTIEINLEPSEVESEFSEHIYGTAGKQVPNFVEQILANNR